MPKRNPDAELERLKEGTKIMRDSCIAQIVQLKLRLELERADRIKLDAILKAAEKAKSADELKKKIEKIETDIQKSKAKTARAERRKEKINYGK